MKYKVYHQDDLSYHVEHPDGTKFRVAKRGLSKPTINKIEAFCSGGAVKKYAEGGDVAPDPVVSVPNYETTPVDQIALPQAPTQEQEAMSTANNVVGGLKNMLFNDKWLDDKGQSGTPLLAKANSPLAQPGMPEPDVQDGATSEIAPNPSEMATQAPAPGAADPDAMYKQMPGYKETASGIQGMADAQGLAAKQSAVAIQQMMDQSQKQHANYMAKVDALDREQDGLKNDIVNQKIDPRALLHNMSTGSKIMAAIGMALSGAGAGLSHQQPAALGIMNKAIEDDIDSQKAELGKKQSLYQMNLHKYRNAEAADAATRLQMNTMLQGSLALAAQKSGSVIAQEKAKMMLGQLKQSTIPYLQQLAMNQVEGRLLGAADGEGGLPVGSEPVALLKDPAYQEKRVVVNGKAYKAPDKETARNVRDVESLAGPVMDAVKQLDQMGPAATVPGTQEYNKAQALRANLATKMPLLAGVQVGAKRLNKEEIEAQQERISDPTKFMQLMNGGIKNDQFYKDFGNELEAMRSNQLIGYKGPKSVSFTPLGQGQKLPLNGKK